MKDLTPLRNRLQKNLKHWRKWARRRDIECFRFYDRDIPEFPFAMDAYGPYLHIQEFSNRAQEAPSPWPQASWEPALTPMLAELAQIPPDQIVFKTRQRQQGNRQYEKISDHQQDIIVHEGGLKFLVNLHAYLDTGLFLDHRHTRSLVRQRAQGTRFLNLFAYTGSFSLYAIAGGARESVTLDLSNRYQQWTLRNLELNQLNGPSHQLVRADVFSYLQQAIEARERFDLIVMDPPSFSNSKKMTEILDVQRDHPRLIEACLQLLNPAGELIFSNNLKGFKFDPSLAQRIRAQEITQQTLPEDFQRHRPHRCWTIPGSAG